MASYPSVAQLSGGFRDITDGECIGTDTQRNRRSSQRGFAVSPFVSCHCCCNFLFALLFVEGSLDVLRTVHLSVSEANVKRDTTAIYHILQQTN